MIKVHYKDDLPPVVVSLEVDGVQQALPEYDFVLRFWSESPSRFSEVGRVNGEWVGCQPTGDGRLTCYVRNKGLGVGRLMCDFISRVSDARYVGGVRVVTVRNTMGVELVPGNSENVVAVIDGVVLPMVATERINIDAVVADCRTATAAAEAAAASAAAAAAALDELSLSDYYTKRETDTLLRSKQDKLSAGSRVSISEQNEIGVEVEAIGNLDILAMARRVFG